MPVTNVKSEWSSGNLVFKRKAAGTAASVSFGVDDSGVDVIMYGDTASSNATWDASADKLILTGASADLGTSVEADSYSVGGTAGIDFSSGSISNIQIIKGIVVYAA
jgi:hypothetical protein